MEALKFAYLSSENPLNKRVWSGTHYSIYTSLQKLGTVEILGPYQPKILLLWLKFINQFCLKLFNKRYNYRHSIVLSKFYALYFERKITPKKFDFIIAPAASCEIAYLKTEIPIIYITDGTIAACLNYHKALRKLTRWSKYQSNRVEQLALQKSSKIIVSSSWCYNSVLKDYVTYQSKVFQFPYGANFELLPTQNELNLEQPFTTFKLLFIGVYWEEKGGPAALQAFNILKNKGYNVNFTIVGCTPKLNQSLDCITIISFIDKNTAAGQEKLKSILSEHQCLILPTRFDCTPIVINEASAFGIPCLVSNTGGVAGHLIEGKNGFLIEYNDDGSEYAKKIESFITDIPAFFELRKSAREVYENSNNWESWTKEFKMVLGK